MPRPAIAPDALCLCGHEHDAHEHFRRGTDCGLCSCRRFRLDRKHASAEPRKTAGAAPAGQPQPGLQIVWDATHTA